MTAALIVFCAMAGTDTLYALYTRRTAAGQALPSAVYAAGLILLSSIVTIFYVESHWLVVAAMAGAFVGTYLTVKADGP